MAMALTIYSGTRPVEGETLQGSDVHDPLV